MNPDQIIAVTVMILLLGWWAVVVWHDRRQRRRNSCAPAATVSIEPDTRAFDRHCKEALAIADKTPQGVVIRSAIWHPCLGPGEILHAEEHPAHTAERILRGES